MPGYPRWAQAVTLQASCYRVSPSGGPCPFAGVRLAVQRRTPRVPEGFSSGCQGCSLGPGGSVPPYGGIPFEDPLAGLEHDLGHPERSFARALAMRGLAHSRP